jgi:predicted dienelactone hydrolase
MKLVAFVFGALCTLAAMLAHAAGLTSVQVPADADGPAIKALVWSPCTTPADGIKLGPFELSGVRNCPVAGDKLPLVAVSHGHGGDYLSHHDTAETLADAGFVVVALDHPGDTVSDMSRSREISVFIERPTDVRRVIDFMLGPSPFAVKIDPARIGFFGFSRGGYTGLVLAGANPDWLHGHARALCPDPPLPVCDEIRRGVAPKELVHDPRIKAFVIADPVNVFPTKANLRAVTAPIQLWSSERGGDGVLPEQVAALVEDLPTQPEFHRVPNSAHFAFLMPCPEEMTKSRPELCQDAPDFDRAAFHQELDAAVLDFLRKHLGP